MPVLSGTPPNFLEVGNWQRVLTASLAPSRHNPRQRSGIFDKYVPLVAGRFIEEDAGVLND